MNPPWPPRKEVISIDCDSDSDSEGERDGSFLAEEMVFSQEQSRRHDVEVDEKIINQPDHQEHNNARASDTEGSPADSDEDDSVLEEGELVFSQQPEDVETEMAIAEETRRKEQQQRQHQEQEDQRLESQDGIESPPSVPLLSFLESDVGPSSMTAPSSMIDLTAGATLANDDRANVSHRTVDLRRSMNASGVASSPTLSFEEEYESLVEDAEVGEFPFEAVASLFLRHSQHWWCRYPEAMAEMLLSLEGGLEDARGFASSPRAPRRMTNVGLLWQESNAQLCACRRCINAYHTEKDRLISRLTLDTSEEGLADCERLKAAILAQDRLRLQASFRSGKEAAVSMAAAIEMAQSGGSAVPVSKLGTEATHAFWEVLSYADLLHDSRIEESFLEALVEVARSGAECFSGSGWQRHWPGVLTLLVHRNATVRSWAQSMARKAGGIGVQEYRDILNPVIERWVPVLELGLEEDQSGSRSASQNEEHLHWSGLHVMLQLLKPEAAPLLAAGFLTLVDLTFQKFDDGPRYRLVSLYLQVCGCFTALLRLLGPRIWDYSSLSPPDVFGAIERRVRGGRNASGESIPPNDAILHKALDALPLLVSSVASTDSSRVKGSNRRGRGDRGSGGALDVQDYGPWQGRSVEKQQTASRRAEGCRESSGADDTPLLADTVLEFLCEQISRPLTTTPVTAVAATTAVAERGRGISALRGKALAHALLDVLETCYGKPVNDGDAHGGRVRKPESWPWNVAGSTDGVSHAISAGAGESTHGTLAPHSHGDDFSRRLRRRNGRRSPLTWPVRSMQRWGPRLADATADLSRLGSEVVDRAASTVERVLQQHLAVVWREALSSLQHGADDFASPAGVSALEGDGNGEGSVDDQEGMLPLCEPLLGRICLVLPLMDLPDRVHAVVFEAHGLLALLPTGESALRVAEARGGPRASGASAKLHSGLMSQYLKLFVPYVKGLTEVLKQRGASVSPALHPEVAPSIVQALLAPVPAAREQLEDLLSHSIVVDERFSFVGSVPAAKRGDLRPLLGRLPRECAQACFLAVPQALAAMAAAGPHFSLKSWGPLFQAADVLGRAALLRDPKSDVWAGESAGGESYQSWAALEAVWEFAFLQVIPEALPALKGEHSIRLEEALRPLFESLESLWPLLTGPIPRQRCPRVSEAFLLSRSLWLEPLLLWVSEPWLPLRAREAAAHFVQSSLLPFLDEGSTNALAPVVHGHGARAAPTVSPSKKVLRLVGNRLGIVEEQEEGDHGGAAGDLSGSEEEGQQVRRLRLAAVAVMTESVIGSSSTTTAQREPQAEEERFNITQGAANPSRHTTSAATVPAAQAVRQMYGLVTSKVSSSWAGRLVDGSASSTAVAKRRSSSSPRGVPTSSANHPVSPSDFGAPLPEVMPKWTPGDETRSGAKDSKEQGRGQSWSAADRRASGSRSSVHSGKESNASWTASQWDTAISLPVPAAGKARASKVASEQFTGDGAPPAKSYVTAAEAAAARAATKVARTTASTADVSSCPRGSVAEKWRKMKLKDGRAIGQLLSGDKSGATGGQMKHSNSYTQSSQFKGTASRPAVAGTPDAAAAAFTAAEQAAERRNQDSTHSISLSYRSSAVTTATLDHASLVKASAAELHRIVLSTWTVVEIMTAATQPHRQGGAGRETDATGMDGVLATSNGNRSAARAREKRGRLGSRHSDKQGDCVLTDLHLSKVPTRFQSVEHYGEVFRGLLLEEIFATLVSAVNGGRGVPTRGGRGGGPAVATLRVTSFVDGGDGGFSHVNMDFNAWDNDDNHHGHDQGARRGGGGMTPAKQGFFHDDILMLSLVDAGGNGASSTKTSGRNTCLGIFDKEARGGVQEARGPSGGNGYSMRVKVLLQPGVDRERERALAQGFVPKKSTANSMSDEDEDSSGPRADLRQAFQERGTQVRVTRLEGLNTSSREFAALEAVPRLALVQHLLQATSDPRLAPVLRTPPSPTNPNPRQCLGPPYPVDQDSLEDACARFLSIQACVHDERDVRENMLHGNRARDGEIAVDPMMSEMMMRSLECLATFRMTSILLRSLGQETARSIKRLSKSALWSTDIRAAAMSLFRAWQGVVAKAPKGGKRKSKSADECEPVGTTAAGQACPERPRLVPKLLWDRLSEEFNPSQLRAVWAAAATLHEIREEQDKLEHFRVRRGREAVTVERTPLEGSRSKEAGAGATAQPSERRGNVSGQDELKAAQASARRVGGEGGVVLLQGPPGTGKTRTVLGVVSAILARQKEKAVAGHDVGPSTNGVEAEGSGVAGRGMGMTLQVGVRRKRPGVAGRWTAAKTHLRLLVCAPSNGAVDELTQRLALEGGGVWDHLGKAAAPRVVRIGKPSEEAAARVKAVSLEFMVEERAKEHPMSAQIKAANAKIQRAYTRIDEAEGALRGGKESAEPTGPGVVGVENRRHQLTTEIRQLRREILGAKQRRRDSWRGLEAERGKIRHSLISNAQVVCATLSGSGSAHLVEAVSSSGKGFDTVIVDEACQATELSTLVPLSLGCKRLILVGDPRQLPATVISQRAARLKLEISLFERLERAGHPVHMLTVQYRMHPEIRAFPSEHFYGGRLTDAPSVCMRAGKSTSLVGSKPGTGSSPSGPSSRHVPPGPRLGPCFPPFQVVDVSSGRERRMKTSYENAQEATFVAAFLSRLVEMGLRERRGVKSTGDRGSGVAGMSGRGGDRGKEGVVTVGVITPYRGQVRRIRQELGDRRLLKGGKEDGGVDVEVDTVDGFQGREVDVVLFSCVRAPTTTGRDFGGIGFLEDRRRMNVAITRARRSLVVLGNARRLCSDGTWKALVDYASSLNRLIPELRTSSGSNDGLGSGAALCAMLEEKFAECTEEAPGDTDRHSDPPALDQRRSKKKSIADPGRDRGIRDRDRLQDTNRRGSGSEHPTTQGSKSQDRISRKAHAEERSDISELSRRTAGQNDGLAAAVNDRVNDTGGDPGVVPSDSREKKVKPRSRYPADDTAVSSTRPTFTSGAKPSRSAGSERTTRDEGGSIRAAAQGASAASGRKSAVAGSSSLQHRTGDDGVRRLPKRARVVADASLAPAAIEDGSSGSSRGGGNNKNAADKKSREKRPSSAAGGGDGRFLEGLMGSVNSNARSIASGKEHDFRQGLRGGEEGERKRAAAAPRLNGARMTELGRVREPTQPAPAGYALSSPFVESDGSGTTRGRHDTARSAGSGARREVISSVGVQEHGVSGAVPGRGPGKVSSRHLIGHGKAKSNTVDWDSSKRFGRNNVNRDRNSREGFSSPSDRGANSTSRGTPEVSNGGFLGSGSGTELLGDGKIHSQAADQWESRLAAGHPHFHSEQRKKARLLEAAKANASTTAPGSSRARSRSSGTTAPRAAAAHVARSSSKAAESRAGRGSGRQSARRGRDVGGTPKSDGRTSAGTGGLGVLGILKGMDDTWKKSTKSDK